jgi:hypothetical protein
MSVPSMSKRTILSASEYVSGVRSRFRPHVCRARPFRRRLLVERDSLPFGELIEAALSAAPVEKPLLPTIVANKTEAAITNEPFDGSAWHDVLPFVLQ